MEVLQEAGLPDGVINLVYVGGPTAADVIFQSPDFAGIHFTGSTGVFQGMWKTIGENIHKYKSYPRIVGETGGKDFIFADRTADPQALAIAMLRGSFEYQGQKCSAASRAYVPQSIWGDVCTRLGNELATVKMGPPEDFTNFINAVIDESSFDKLAGYIDQARKDDGAEVLFGGACDKSVGYFIEPTVILAKTPDYITMVEELFGPVLTVYVYPDEEIDRMLDILDRTSIYALTGAIFSQDRYSIERITKRLENAAGNFYINDKPTGAVVGQQPLAALEVQVQTIKLARYSTFCVGLQSGQSKRHLFHLRIIPIPISCRIRNKLNFDRKEMNFFISFFFVPENPIFV